MGSGSYAVSERRRVLLVDDEESLAWSLGSRLGKSRPGYQVTVAHEGESALAELRKMPVDLLIVDVRMPGMSGIDVVLAARATTPQLPVIVMTAFKTIDLQRISGETATTFLEKPFEFDSFVEVVDRSLATLSQGFSGAISVQTLPDVVQLYVLSNTSGVLSVRRGDVLGQLVFERGQITHASAGAEDGEAAFYQIMSWQGGEFWMSPLGHGAPRSIHLDWQSLLLESCRRMDERDRDGAPVDDDVPRVERGWTEIPSSLPPDSFTDFDTPVPKYVAPVVLNTLDDYLTENIPMNVKESLSKLNEIDGFIGAALVDSESGMMLGQEGGGPLDLEVAAAANTEVVRAKRKAMASLNLKDGIEDILITLGRQYHLIRPLRSRNAVFYYVALDRSRANLAMARIALADVEKDLQL